MCLHVWSICRYTGSLSKNHFRCLRHLGKVSIICRSLICFGSEPFRLEEQLLSAEGEIFLLTNLATVAVTLVAMWEDHIQLSGEDLYRFPGSLKLFNKHWMFILIFKVFMQTILNWIEKEFIHGPYHPYMAAQISLVILITMQLQQVQVAHGWAMVFMMIMVLHILGWIGWWLFVCSWS